MTKKGKLDPMSLAGFFITFLLLAAMWKPVTMFVSGIAGKMGTLGSYIVTLIPALLIFAVVVTLWEYAD